MKMKRCLSLLLAIGSLLAAVEAAAREGDRSEDVKVAVFPFSAKKGVPKETAEVLSDVFLGEARKVKGYDIVSIREVKELIGLEMQRQMMGCTETGCAVEIAGALGVNSVVLGTVAVIGGNCVVTIRRIKALDASLEANYSKTVAALGAVADAVMLGMIQEAVKEIFPGEARKQAAATTDKASRPAPSPAASAGRQQPASQEESQQASGAARSTAVTAEVTPEPAGRTFTWLAAGIAGAGLAAGVVGSVLYYSAGGELDDLKKQPSVTTKELDDVEAKGDLGAMLTNIGYGVAAAGAVAAIVLYYVESPNESGSSLSLAPSFGAGAGGITAVARF